jgi:myo-inositol-1(or 4)-monophosphatase
MTDEDLVRIREGLAAARAALRALPDRPVGVRSKGAAGPVTDADHAIDAVLRATLPRAGEGWLSEETADDPRRLDCRRVWVVDPLDGTKEFVLGIPEWAISVALVEDGRAVAGGIVNPVTGETFVGAIGRGLLLNDRPAQVRTESRLAEALVLASRSEVGRGEWEGLGGAFALVPMGSVAYKMARVAAGLADATWTLVPKSEWDVAAGCALVVAGGGRVRMPSGEEPRFNQARPLFPGFVATSAACAGEVEAFLRTRSAPVQGSDGGRVS